VLVLCENLLNYKLFIVVGFLSILGGYLIRMIHQSEIFVVGLLDCDYSIINLKFGIIIDSISLSFRSSLLVIVGCVYLFRNYYMGDDKKKIRFFFLLRAFVFSMLILIFCPHIIFVFVGYDGLGIVRFLLVVYYNRSQS